MRFENLLSEGNMEDPFDIVEELYAVSFPYIKEYLKVVRPDYRAKMLFSGRDGSDVRAIKKIRVGRAPKDTPQEAHDEMDDMFKDFFGERYRSNSVFCTSKYTMANGYGDSVYGLFPTGNSYGYCWSPHIPDLYTQIIDSGDPEYEHFMWDVGDVIDQFRDNDIGDYGGFDEELRDEFAQDHDISDYYDDLPEVEDGDEDEGGYTEDERDNDAQNMYDEEQQEYVDSYIDERLNSYLEGRAENSIENSYQNVHDEISNYKDDDLGGALESGHEVMLTGKSCMMIRSDYLPYVIRYMEKFGSKKPTRDLFLKAMEGVDLNRYIHRNDKRNVKRHFKKFVNDDLLKMMDDLKDERHK